MACNKPTSQNYRQSHPSSSHIWVTRYSDASLHTTLNCTGSQERVGSAAAGAGGEVPLFPCHISTGIFPFSLKSKQEREKNKNDKIREKRSEWIYSV